jgi:hypothetical protein
MKCFIYIHRRLDTNEIFYVGRGTINKKSSGKCHKNKYSRAYVKHKHNKYWLRITEKTEWSIEILEDNLSWDESTEREIFYIKHYGRKDLNLGTLVNNTDGGEGSINLKVSDYVKEVQRKRMSSESNPMKLPHNREKQSIKMKNNNPMKNPEISKKVTDSIKKYWELNPELHPRKNKPREDLRQRNLTDNPAKKPEVKEKIRQHALNRNNKGGNSPNAKSVKYTKTGKTYNSIIECSNDIGVSHTTIYRYLKNGLVIYI